MNGSRMSLSAVSTATLIAFGAMLLWCAVVFPPTQYVTSRQARNGIYEKLVVLTDGTALISSSRAGAAVEYRDLRGEVVATAIGAGVHVDPNSGLLQPGSADLQAPMAPTVALAVKEINPTWSWTWRIMGFSDGLGGPRDATTLWYLIRQKGNRGGAYFVGYDQRSRRVIGYLAPDGFRANLPPSDQRFSLSEDFDPNHIATAQPAYFGQPIQGHYWNYSSPGASLDIVYMALPDRIARIDLRRRTVDTFAEIANTQSIAVVRYYGRVGPGPIGVAPAGRLYARTPESIVVIDQEGTVEANFSIPSELTDDDLLIYLLADGQVVMDATRRVIRHELFWVNADGSVSRHEPIELAMSHYEQAQAPFWAGLLAPSPLAMTGLIVAEGIRGQGVNGEAFSQAAANVTARLAAPCVIYLVISSALAWLVYRRERSDRRARIGWGGFVFLLGIPGVIGYLFHRKRSPRRVFSAPAALGIEIFA